jgi:probable phosphoglycerate mutase
MEKTRFLLVRHGLTDAIGRYLSGTAEGTALNATGKAQVERLVECLRPVRLAAVVSSPLERTRQTAEPIAASHGLPVRIEPAFVEYEVGSWTGRPFPELDRDPAWPRFNSTRSLVRPPGGELMAEVQLRAVNALLDLAVPHRGTTVAVVSHGDVIRAVLMYFLGMPLDFVHRIEISPARISVVSLEDHSPTVLQVNGDGVPEGE